MIEEAYELIEADLDILCEQLDNLGIDPVGAAGLMAAAVCFLAGKVVKDLKPEAMEEFKQEILIRCFDNG